MGIEDIKKIFASVSDLLDRLVTLSSKAVCELRAGAFEPEYRRCENKTCSKHLDNKLYN